MEEDHQQAIKEKDVAFSYWNNQIWAIQHENLASIVMFLVQMIQIKITLWLLRKTPPLKKMSFMSIPTIMREYNDGLLAQKHDGLRDNILFKYPLKRKGL